MNANNLLGGSFKLCLKISIIMLLITESISTDIECKCKENKNKIKKLTKFIFKMEPHQVPALEIQSFLLKAVTRVL